LCEASQEVHIVGNFLFVFIKDADQVHDAADTRMFSLYSLSVIESGEIDENA
jgi:hypothetical protein